jgi:RNA polymerase sigma-70 factor (ECF subfamily)
LQAAPADFSTVYAAWFRPVYRWVRALGGPEADGEDLTQEVFTVVQRKLAEFDGQNLSGWLYGITKRVVNDHRRRSWFRNIFLRPRDVALEEIQSGDAGSETLLERKEEQRRFYALVGQMNARWRNTFVLFEIVGYSGEEIAALEGIPAATVRTHLHRARREFLALVSKEQR